MEIRKPYIGITGFMRPEEVAAVLEALPESPIRVVMVGVLASWKTLNGIPNKYPRLFPRIEHISNIFPNHPFAVNLIHYSTDEPSTLSDQLVRLTGLGGPNLHGFQLNIVWPDIESLEAYRRQHSETRIVLQIGSKAFSMIEDSPPMLVAKVSEYIDLVTDVLLDPSGGRGQPFNTGQAREYLYALRERDSDIGLGVAGGLGPSTLELVEPLLLEFPELNIDAQGQLRNQEGDLDLERAITYLLKALQMFPRRST